MHSQPSIDHEAQWDRLEEMEKENERMLHHLTEDALGESLGESIQELSTYDNHPADIATELYEREKDLGTRDRLSRELDEIVEAKKRITEGIYGICEDCGETINTERMEAMPTATLCIRCQREEESLHPDRHPRPIEEDAPPYPWGGQSDHLYSIGEHGADHDGKDPVMYDGEDTWQEVAAYGSSDSPSDIEFTPEYPNIYPDHGERIGGSEAIEMIPVEKDKDGTFYQDMDGFDDEIGPRPL
ncbi:TraR/DksA C4-type zinc finger protein [Heliorestis convoluta]|uniref:TraR/DksA family transcriptional regulator, putative n=1 Tax=Heliorestis convoluta TaxID=356322 RepID=A0A5Q2N2Z2_9FIRM|nr:TraR/DksA C4-type zinc finger protein [Heliorestis convoluta]QGG47956.1 TraR/DksA family transcriptional regulator, putative [Heliorestis convoluta]